jgi:hypothetical protein
MRQRQRREPGIDVPAAPVARLRAAADWWHRRWLDERDLVSAPNRAAVGGGAGRREPGRAAFNPGK